MDKKHLKEMFNILSHQGNLNQNNSEISPYTCQNGLRLKIQVIANAGKNVEQGEHSFIIANLHSHFRTKYGGISENWE